MANGSDGKITIELDLDDVKFVKKLREDSGKAKNAGKKAGDNYSKGFSGAVSAGLGFLGAQLFIKAMEGVKNSVGAVAREATKLETFEVQFKTILKTTAAAQKQLEDLRDFAATTPFQLEGLVTSTRQLLSFGVAQKEIIPTLRQIGDLAAGVGANIEDLTIPFGRLISTQKLTLVELDKFADRGINLYGKLSQQTGISLKNIRDEISKGRINFNEFTKALSDMTSEGGMFFQATQAQAKSLAGLYSTLNDNINDLAGTIGTKFAPLIRTIIKEVTEATSALSRMFKTIPDLDKLFGVDPAAKLKETNVEIENLEKNLTILRNKFAIQKAGVEEGGFAGMFQKFIGDPEETRMLIAENEVELQMARDKQAQLTAELGAETEGIAANTAKSMNVVAKEISKTGKQIASVMKNVIVASTSQAIQRLSTNLVQGKSLFQDFGKFILNVMGDMAIKIGEVTLASGIAMSALGNLSPGATIAAGAGLIAIGAAIKAFAGGGGAGVGDVGTVGSTGAVDTGFAPGGIETQQIQEDERQAPTNIAVNIQGDVLDSEESSLRIVNLINDAFDKTGAVITRGAIA